MLPTLINATEFLDDSHVIDYLKFTALVLMEADEDLSIDMQESPVEVVVRQKQSLHNLPKEVGQIGLLMEYLFGTVRKVLPYCQLPEEENQTSDVLLAILACHRVC
jgi:uncharacterized protein (UPF0128 family)